MHPWTSWLPKLVIALAFSATAVLNFAGCQVDTPNPIAPPGSDTPVDRLSQLGIFIGNVADQVPRSDFHSYEVNVPLYSDGASKLRFAYVPPGAVIGVTADRWTIPVGAYFVKTFYVARDARDPSLGRQLIETRFLVKQTNGLRVSTYLWNEAQTDAIASGGNVDVPASWVDEAGVEHDDHFHVPGTSQCQSCHSNRVLGLRSRQLVGQTPELEQLLAAGFIDQLPAAGEPLSDPFGSAPLDDRARSYLDANCAHCHATDGSAADTKVYWDREQTDRASLPLCRSTADVDGRDRVIVPGAPESSELLARMRSSDAFLRMPRGPTHVPDGKGIAVLSEWIAGMPAGGCK